jgi:hypothetical protein
MHNLETRHHEKEACQPDAPVRQQAKRLTVELAALVLVQPDNEVVTNGVEVSASDTRAGRVPCSEAPDLFIPNTNEKPDVRALREAKAKVFCGTCLVRTACLDAALNNGERRGVWGGLGEDERKPLHDGFRRKPSPTRRYVSGKRLKR